jgi:MoxR-like ATPase
MTQAATPVKIRPAAARPAAPPPGPAAASVQKSIQSLVDEVGKVMVGKREVLELVSMVVLTEGAHILFEDLPGLGKSVMASAFARASGTIFKRVQFTPDLLPSDITGTYVLNQGKGDFEFHAGPIFTNILLADEINRASPKTQSALLEAMAEKQVSMEGTTHKLPKPFLVMATQNPIEQEGTYPLPEAQLDRFMIKASVGHPNLDEEQEILNRRNLRMKDDFDVKAATTAEDIVRMQKAVEQVHIDPALVRYIAALVVKTREHPQVLAGASPRGSLALLKLSKASAALAGRNYVVPDDIRRLVDPVLGHRLILRPEPRIRGVKTTDVLREIVQALPVPKV